MKLTQRIRNAVGDPLLLLAVVALSIFGIAMIYSATRLQIPNPAIAGLWKQQILWLVISLVTLAVLLRVPVRWYEWLAVPGYILSVALLGLTLIIGTGQGTAEGVRSWIDLGPISFQPSQFSILAMILMLGHVLGERREPLNSLWDLWKPIAVAAVPTFLIFLQPDLGTAAVSASVLLAVLYWGGVPLGYLFLLLSPLVGVFLAFQGWIFSAYMVALIGFVYFYGTYLWEGVLVVAANLATGVVALPLWASLEEYQRERLLVFLNPQIDPQGAGYQVIQSRVAIGSGGLFGKGYLEGTQKALGFLPEQHTDFIFAVIGEELGFVGATAVLLAFGFVLWRMIRDAEKVPDPFAGTVVFGMFGFWFAHILINIGVTIGIVPVTGIPLPFLSYGGSFLLSSYIGLGMMERMIAEQGRKKV